MSYYHRSIIKNSEMLKCLEVWRNFSKEEGETIKRQPKYWERPQNHRFWILERQVPHIDPLAPVAAHALKSIHLKCLFFFFFIPIFHLV